MTKSFYRKRHSRFVWLFYLTMVLFIYLINRLVSLQAHEHEKFARIARWRHTGMIEIKSLRGSIYDRNGVSLAFSLSLPSIAANPKLVENPERTAYYLSLALNEDRENLAQLLQSKCSFVWLARKVKVENARSIAKLELPGILIIDEPSGKRFYPKGRTACHVLGFTGIDDQGLEGIEANYNLLLSGKPGKLKAEMDEPGRVLPGGKVEYLKPVPGKNVHLTIDETIQYIVEKELEKTVKKRKADSGTVIVYDPRTGDILALANYPDFDPSQALNFPQKNLRNKAICDSYEPGSTFKVILAASALDSGLIDIDERFFSGKSLQIGGYSLKNAGDGLYSPTGYESIKEIITYSFNTGAASVGLKIGKKVFYRYIKDFGFGELTGIQLPGETEGIVTPGKYWKPINLATISYGQGIAVTPIQLVQAYAAIANEGVMMKPRIVKKITEPDGKIYREIKPTAVGRVLKPKTCHQMLKILTNVCENGTGKKARIPGYTVGGKTGTANIVEDGVYVSGKYVASFIGIVPIEDPRLVILVKIDNPKGIAWGGSVAGPVFKNVASRILWKIGVKPRGDNEISFSDSTKNEDKGE